MGGSLGCGLHTVLVRRRAPPPSLARALLWHAGVGSPCGRDPRGSRWLGALRRAVCRFSRTPPPRVAVPSGGGGAPPRLRGGRRVAPLAPKLGGGSGGGVGGAAPPHPAPSGVVGLPSLVSGVPPRVRRRPAAGRVCGRLPRPWCPLSPGAAASPGGVRGRRFFGLPPSALGPEWEGGGGSGGGPLVPWRRLLTAEGGAAWRSRPRGAAIAWGVAPCSHPPLPRAGPSCRPSLGPLVPPAVNARRWPAGGGREG